MWMTLLAAVLGKLPGLLGEYFTKKGELAKAELETREKIELQKQAFASQLAMAEVEKAKATLLATSSTFKYITFFLWYGPFISGMISKDYSRAIFDNMAYMPEWYVTSCVTIMFTVWGIAVSAPVVSNIFTNMAGWFAERKDAKREHQEVMARIKIDRAKYWDDWATVNGRRPTQQQVDDGDKIFDALDTGSVTTTTTTKTGV